MHYGGDLKIIIELESMYGPLRGILHFVKFSKFWFVEDVETTLKAVMLNLATL
jgi:hypothetical protein